MALQYLGEIRLFPYNFAPRQWAYCAGQILSISQNTALFSLLGTTYGGNGTSTFALPDLRGRALLSQSFDGSYNMGQAAGTETVTLTQAQIPAHNHIWNATSEAADQAQAAGNYLGAGRAKQMPAALYGPVTNPVVLAPATVGLTGGSQPHSNMQPYLVLTYCIALQGVFPSRN